MSDIVTLPKRKRFKREQADTFRQLAFEFEFADEARAEIDNAIYRLTEEPGERWLFMKISQMQFRYVASAIRECQRATSVFSVWNSVFSVWNAAITYIRQDTGEILATRECLATDAGIHSDEVSRAMTTLTKIGAILKTRRGQRVVYSINPHVGWNGGEGTRQAAVKEAPKLRLVSNRDEESPT